MSGSDTPAPTVAEIEAELTARRQQLATSVDELLYQVQPKQIVRRQGEKAQLAFYEATHTPDGELRAERVAGVLGAVAAALIGLGLIRRANS